MIRSDSVSSWMPTRPSRFDGVADKAVHVGSASPSQSALHNLPEDYLR